MLSVALVQGGLIDRHSEQEGSAEKIRGYGHIGTVITIQALIQLTRRESHVEGRSQLYIVGSVLSVSRCL